MPESFDWHEELRFDPGQRKSSTPDLPMLEELPSICSAAEELDD